MALSYAYAAAEVMEHLCKHSTHGYSQPNRQGVGTGASVFETITLSDGTKVTIAQGDRDCSSAAIECYAALGVDCGGASYTGNMRKCMTKTGNFKWISGYSKSKVKRGDILLNETHHTAVALGGGKLGQFSISERGTTHGTRGDQTGYESNVKALYNYPWNGILRYCGPARKGSSAPSEPVRQPAEQTWRTAYGDPEWFGPKMAKAWQKQLGTVADGVISGQPTSNKTYFWAVSGGVTYGSSGSDAVLALQKGLKAAGYDPNGLDRYYGRGCIKAHQKWLKSKGYYTGKIDGYHGHETNEAMCKALAAGAYKKL